MNSTAILTIPTIEQLKACEIRLDLLDHVRFAPTLEEFVLSAVLSDDGRDLVTMILEATVSKNNFHIDVQRAKIIRGNSEPEGTTDLEVQSALIGACLQAVATGHLAEIQSQIEGFRSQIAAAHA